MVSVLTDFLSTFYPNIDTFPEPVLVIVGTVTLGVFFGLILRIFGR